MSWSSFTLSRTMGANNAAHKKERWGIDDLSFLGSVNNTVNVGRMITSAELTKSGIMYLDVYTGKSFHDRRVAFLYRDACKSDVFTNATLHQEIETAQEMTHFMFGFISSRRVTRL